MKIVRIIARLNVGGPARHVVWLTKSLQSEKHNSVLLTGTVPDGEEDMSYFAAENGVSPFYIPEMSRELSPKDVISLWKVFRKLLAEKPDVIHTHTAKAGTIGRAAGFLYRLLTLRKVKIVHTYHGHVFHSYYGNAKTKLFLAIEKTLAWLTTDKIIVISRQQYEEIHKQFGVGKESQFKIVPLGIDFEPFRNGESKRERFRSEFSADDKTILVGLVGRLTEIKNHELFLKVAQIYKLRKTADSPDLKFIIVGDGHLRQALEESAKNLQIEDVVVFSGNRNDTDAVYAGLDIVALTSLNEGTPLSLIEAMANTRPVISTEVGGVVDLLGEVKSENNEFSVCERGIKTASNNLEGFYEGLIFLAENDALRAQISSKGKEFVTENYSKERLVSDLSGLYDELTAKKR